MKKIFSIFFVVLVCFLQASFAQIPVKTLVQIVKAEDERRWDSTLENLLKNPDVKIRERAALAAGRIGDERAIPVLSKMILTDETVEVRTMVAFALGEIESAECAEPILNSLRAEKNYEIHSRAIEAAGKIIAANPKDTKSNELGKEIIQTLEEEAVQVNPNSKVVLAGITAVLRAKPEGGETVVAKFLSAADAKIRADALNTLARLRSKNVNDQARDLLAKDLDPIVRANAARMLGIGEDKSAIDLLLNVATKDVDLRVRVSAVRSLGNFKDERIGLRLVVQMRKLIIDYAESINRKKYEKPLQQNELLEITSTLGKLFANKNDQAAVQIIQTFNIFDKYESPEGQLALAKIAPSNFSKLQKSSDNSLKSDWKVINALMAGIGELANAPDSAEITPAENFAKAQAAAYVRGQLLINQSEDKTLSDALAAYAAFKTEDLAEILTEASQHRDPIVRATAAGILADQTVTKENVEALKSAFTKSLLTDKHENDAQLAILDALYKLDKKAAVGTFLVALGAPDYLVRKKAFEILKDEDLRKDFPGIQSSIESFMAKKGNQILPYAAYTGTKLGQIHNTNADYIRAVSRKSGTVKAVLTTTKGNFTIDFFPEDAPLAVDNFIKLARSNYFNGLSVHRVVPNFVMQDGDPRGDGNGGPGWQIRCEINMLSYDRGAVGMALSGKDTGGSQWFVTHSPQPHLDGGYTVFGKVNENDMKIVDSIVRGDKILSVKIIEKKTLGK